MHTRACVSITRCSDATSASGNRCSGQGNSRLAARRGLTREDRQRLSAGNVTDHPAATVIVDKQQGQRIAGLSGTVQRPLIDAPSLTGSSRRGSSRHRGLWRHSEGLAAGTPRESAWATFARNARPVSLPTASARRTRKSSMCITVSGEGRGPCPRLCRMNTAKPKCHRRVAPERPSFSTYGGVLTRSSIPMSHRADKEFGPPWISSSASILRPSRA
jgi:hypothetical protein